MEPDELATRKLLKCTGRKLYNEDRIYSADALMGLTIEQDIQGGNGSMNTPYRIAITVRNSLREKWCGVIKFELEKEETEAFFYLPGYMYGHNRGEAPNSGRKEFPRIRRQGGARCESNFWMTRSDRLAAPVAMAFDSGRLYGISAPPIIKGGTNRNELLCFNGFTCRTNHKSEQGKTMASVGFTLGYENAPYLFVQTATVCERAPLCEENCFCLEPGAMVTIRVELYDFSADDKRAVYRVIEGVYGNYHQEPRKLPDMNIKTAVTMLAEAVSEAAWLPEEKMYSGFVFQKREGYTYNKIGSLSWTNGLAVATPMLISALRLNNENMRTQAITCIQNIVENCINPMSGLPYDAVNDGVWSVHGWWFDGMRNPGHSGYLVGQAVYYVLKAYEYEEKLRYIKHEDWLDFALSVLRVVNSRQNSDGEYPFVMSEETAAGLEYDSIGSSWCLAATALYTRLTDTEEFMQHMLRSEKHYYEHYVANVECYGGPLDTDKAVDSEGVLAYIRAVRYLHEITGEDLYLAHLKDAICYECTFKLCYNTPVQVPPLSTVGWSSCGGSITSTANPHIHPMSSTIIDEMIYCANKTKDAYIRSRLRDTMLWGLQTFNTFDGEYDYGKKGWMSERFCFCQGLLTERYPDNSPASTWFALMPWASASILEGFVGDCWQE